MLAGTTGGVGALITGTKFARVLPKIDSLKDVWFVGLANWYHFTFNYQGMVLDVLYFSKIYNIGPMYLHKMIAIHFFFHFFQGAMGEIMLGTGNVFYVVADALNIKYIAVAQTR